MIRISIRGIVMEIHFSFILLTAVLAAAGNGNFVLAILFFSILHEYAHGKTAQILGYSPEKITANFFGGVLHLQSIDIKPFHEMIIHLSGPALNLFIGTALFIVSGYWNNPCIEAAIFANLILGVFNMIPFYPLDGGKIVTLYLANFIGWGRAYWLSKNISIIFYVFLFFLGIYLVQYNPINLLICLISINLMVTVVSDYEFMLYKLSLKELRRINEK
ncbi:MAG: site-2 protease family protein [Anaerovoracaceae bacterium]|jgi:Zn-dependent protease